ncbi:mechanosensitive ion channel domain-containing protein [Tritonibacter horizontis]|uniref:Moderate conductance mechanosensitive channel YbiO n=1 Tax=Tritonibacter horizontis TaxID=1768241 RepID=A0A132C1H1_9RHOB|nr:moderate conductance mechanosensitive channel YbiO precursor [Tritonibacter horizontis]
MQSLFFALRGWAVALLLTLGMTLPALAQIALPTAGGAAPEASAEVSALAEAIRQASEAGVSVVIVDRQGQPVPTATVIGADGADAGQGQGDKLMGEASAMMHAQTEIRSFREKLDERLQALPNSLIEMTYILRATSPDGRIMTYLEVLGVTTLLLLIGRWLSIEVYGKRFIQRFVVSRIEANPVGYPGKMPFLLMRFATGLGATLVAMVFALVVTMLVFGPSGDVSVEFTSLAVYLTFFGARTISDLWRMVLSPYLSQYRIPSLTDRDARRLYLWVSTLATFDIAAVMVATWVKDFGLNYNIYALTYSILVLVSSLLGIAMVLVNGRAVTRAIRAVRAGQSIDWPMRLLSWIWAPMIIGYVAFGWLALTFDLVLERPSPVPPNMGLFAVLSSILVVYGLINYVIEHIAGRRRVLVLAEDVDAADDTGAGADPDADPGPRTGPGTGSGTGAAAGTAEQGPGAHRLVRRPQAHPLATFRDLARRAAGVLAFAGGALALILVWDADFRIEPDSVLDSILDVLTILFIGYLVFHIARIWIDSKIAEENQDEEDGELGDEGGGSSASRLATLLPLFRGGILAVVTVSIVLIALMETGVNVSPLFAGAGVVGLAVGFGSQTLVRDVFSGAFFLIDDAFRRGEYIDIGSVKGTVEKISVRSFQLRHHLGPLHTIPFGEIQVLTNYSRDWVIMKLPLRVTYDTDVERVRKMIKALGQDLLKDPVIGENFLQPLKSQGVIEMQDSAMIIRVKFMTKPGDQWLVRKKVFEEIRALFQREGIKFAHREVTVRVVDDAGTTVSGPKRDAALGAAHGVIEEAEMDANSGGDDR